MRLWINDIVHAYENKQKGKFAPLSDRHVEQLAAIGFDLQQQ